MSHCKAGEKAVIKYKFPEKQETTYTTKNAPIEVTVRPITAKNYVFTGYYCEYWIDDCNQQTGRVEQSVRYTDPGVQFSDGTLISPTTKVVYPPFDYPITGFGQTGIGESNYCRYQYYRQGIRFSDSSGTRKIAYFNFLGSAERPSRQSSNCYPPYVIRSVTFRRVDGKQDPLKWEINILDSKQNSFTDYGLGTPTYTCQCGDCSESLFRVEI